MRWLRAVALDLDGTLTTGGWPSAAVLDRIAALRADGVAVVLATGRIIAQLDIECPGLTDCFDMVVAENGCVLKSDGWCRPLADPVDSALLERLHSAGFAVSRGQVLLGTTSAADHIALDAVEDLGLVLGSDLHGRPVVMPAARTSVLISGGSESGKSYVAGLIVEQLIAQELTTFVLDPEGTTSRSARCGGSL